MGKQTEKYPFSKDQRFSIALIKYNDGFYSPDHEIHYLRNVKPNSKDFQYWPDTNVNEWNIYFDTSEIIGFDLPVHSRMIFKKAVDSVLTYAFIVSTEDNELELKEILIKHQMHSIEERLNDIEEEKRKFKELYSKLSKHLIERHI